MATKEQARIYRQKNLALVREKDRIRARLKYAKAPHNRSVLRRRDIQSRLAEIKLASGCVDCGYAKNPAALHFDHVRGEKIGAIASMVSGGTPWKFIEAELKKCEVRCANCHAEKTWSKS